MFPFKLIVLCQRYLQGYQLRFSHTTLNVPFWLFRCIHLHPSITINNWKKLPVARTKHDDAIVVDVDRQIIYSIYCILCIIFIIHYFTVSCECGICSKSVRLYSCPFVWKNNDTDTCHSQCSMWSSPSFRNINRAPDDCGCTIPLYPLLEHP